MATVKLVQRADQIRRDGTAPVYVRVTINRKSRYIKTGVYLEPKDWSAERQLVRKTHELSKALNNRLGNEVMRVRAAAVEAPTAHAAKARLGRSSGSFTRFAERYISNLEAAGRFWDWKKYQVTLRKIQNCLGKTIDFQEIDLRAIERFEVHLRKTCQNSANTVRKEMQRFSRILKLAAKDGLITMGDSPFLTYDRPKGNAPSRRKLTIEEIRALAELELELTASQIGVSAETDLRITRDAFCVAFYGGGVRFSDICLLGDTNIRGGRIEYAMMKTGSVVSFPIPPVAQRIVAPYPLNGGGFIFPYLERADVSDPIGLRRRISSRNVVVNRHLKTLAVMARMADPESVSFHVARHSFADIARQRSGGDLYAVSKALGHTSLNVTQQYLKSFDREATDRLGENMWTDD